MYVCMYVCMYAYVCDSGKEVYLGDCLFNIMMICDCTQHICEVSLDPAKSKFDAIDEVVVAVVLVMMMTVAVMVMMMVI